jgi:uncharacterized protein (TIGR02996 family)
MGTIVGTFTLPLSGREAASIVAEAPEAGDLPVMDLMVPPQCSKSGPGKNVMVWITDDGRKMVWRPETEEEIAEARRFYEASRNPGCPQVPEHEVFPIAFSDEEQRLLAAIVEHPEDDRPRELYADWLTRQGDPRGEFIRSHLIVYRYPSTDSRNQQADEVAWNLLQEHGQSWYRPLAALGLWPTMWSEFCPQYWMSRGLIEHAEVNVTGIFPERTGLLFQAAPSLIELVIQLGNLDVAKTFAHPQFNQIRGLTFKAAFDGTLENKGLIALTESQNLSRLERLNISKTIVDHRGVDALAKSPLMGRLKELDISNCDLSDNEADILARSKKASQLKHLDLQSNDIGAQGAIALLTSSQLSSLETLDLSTNRSIGQEGLDSLSAPPSKCLKCLRLGLCDLDESAARILIDWLEGSHLEELELWRNNLPLSIVERLSQSKGFKRLKGLDLSWNPIGDASVQALVKSPRRLESLKLNQCGLHAVSVRAIADAPHFAQLKTLELYENPIGFAGAELLAKSRYLQNLTSLQVGENTVGEEGRDLLKGRFGEGVVVFQTENE